MSLFITFEGIEGCGKSYQSKLLYKKMQGLDLPVILTYEPGGTHLGNAIRNLLKKTSYSIDYETELFLFNASRVQLIKEVIRPALDKDKIIICDRYTDSTVVYQGYGRGLDMEKVCSVNTIATQGIKPDITVLLDLPVQSGLDRKKNRHMDRFDAEEIAFHERVRNGFLEMAAAEKNRWMVIDGLQPPEIISDIIWDKIKTRLRKL